jgi:E3 ubiquitin-protein ligase HERC2
MTTIPSQLLPVSNYFLMPANDLNNLFNKHHVQYNIFILINIYIGTEKQFTMKLIGWGWLSWLGGSTGQGPHILDFFNDVGGVCEVACAERCMLVLAKNGKVFMMYYSADTPVSYVHFI